MSTFLISKSAIVCDKSGGTLQLRVERDYGCGHCAGSSVCGLAAFSNGNAMRLWLPVPESADIEVGQTIGLALPEAGLGRLAVLHYLTIPVLMFTGALLFAFGYGSGGDLLAMLGGTIGFLVGCAVLKLYDSRAGQYWLDRLEMRHLPE